MAISMLKIRRPLGRLIFNMGIAIPGKTVFLIDTAPWIFVTAVQMTALSQHLNQCWLISDEGSWHSFANNFTNTLLDITYYKVFENFIIENTVTSSRCQRVKMVALHSESDGMLSMHFCCTEILEQYLNKSVCCENLFLKTLFLFDIAWF